MLQTIGQQQRDLVSTTVIRTQQCQRFEYQLSELQKQISALQAQYDAIKNEYNTAGAILTANHSQILLNKELIIGLGFRYLFIELYTEIIYIYACLL